MSKLRLLIAASGFCSALSSALEVALSPRAEQEIGEDAPGPAVLQEQRGGEMVQRLVRRQQEGDTLQRNLEDDREAAGEMQTQVAEGKYLDHMLQSVGQGLNPGPTRDFLLTLRLCVPCRNYARFGDAHDDGFVMCSDNLDSGLTAALSYGIDGHDGWGMAAASRYHIPLHEYTASIQSQQRFAQAAR